MRGNKHPDDARGGLDGPLIAVASRWYRKEERHGAQAAQENQSPADPKDRKTQS